MHALQLLTFPIVPDYKHLCEGGITHSSNGQARTVASTEMGDWNSMIVGLQHLGGVNKGANADDRSRTPGPLSAQ